VPVLFKLLYYLSQFEGPSLIRKGFSDALLVDLVAIWSLLVIKAELQYAVGKLLGSCFYSNEN
jgi:hypothetical protein